jgi:hypothetical protein
MTRRKLYANDSLIANFLKGLTKVETLDNGWSTKFLDKKTGQHWLKSQVNAEYQGGGSSILIQLPEPSTSELIEIIFNSNNEDEVVAASLKLRDNEQYHDKEFRQELIDKLNQIELYDLPFDEKQRLINIIEYSELNSEINRREILNKTLDQVQQDANYFKTIARQADTILRRLDKK